MHVKAKQVAFLGLLAAIVSLFIILASIIESNTLFLLAAAAFLSGVAIREFGLRLGIGFFLACMLLGLLLSPNKLYVLTYTGFSAYIVWREAIYRVLLKRTGQINLVLFFTAKLLFFNFLYIPMLIFLPQLIYQGTFSLLVYAGLFAAGQIGWLLYDKAYEYFQIKIWGKLRNRIGWFGSN